MSGKIIILFLIIVCFTIPFAKTLSCSEILPVSEERKDDEGLTHIQVILPSAISAFLAGIFIIEDALFCIIEWGDSEIWIKRGTLFSIHVPLYFVSPFSGLLVTGISASCFTTYEFLRDRDVDFFRNFFFTGVFQAGIYSTYLSYKKNRVKARSGVYNDRWRQKTFAAGLSGSVIGFDDVYEKWEPYTLTDLLAAPFTPEHLFDPLIGILPFAGVLGSLITRSHDSAPWTTGTMYAGTWEMNPFAAIPLMFVFFFIESCIVSISEESHFRGFIYEEMGSNFGHIIAKIIDCIYFPSIHISQEVFISNFTPLVIASNFLSRAFLTFYMDTLYDRGGLQRTVAAHFWIDFSLLFTQWLMVSGSPQEDISSILMLLPGFQIRIPLDY